MARANAYVKTTSGFYTEAGTLIWGDLGLQATELANALRPNRNPLAGDPAWNQIQSDYVSQSDTAFQKIISALNIGNVPQQSNVAFLISDQSLVEPLTSNAVLVALVPYGASGGGPQFGANNLAYSWISTIGPSQPIDINGSTGGTIKGLGFQPAIGNSGAAGTLTSVVSVLSQVSTRSPGMIGSTITEIDHFKSLTSLLGNPTVTTLRDFYASGGGLSNTALHVAFDCGTLGSGTTKIGFREQGGAGATNRFNNPTRFGDQNSPNVGLEAAKGFGVNVQTQTATYQALVTDYVIFADATTAAFTVTLPAANAGGTGIGQKIIIIKKDSTVNAVTVSRAGTDTIQGATTLSLATQYQKAELISDNSATWYDLGAGLV